MEVKRKARGRTPEQMRAMRQKYGLGEFAKKGRVKTAAPPDKTPPGANMNVKVRRARARNVPRGTSLTMSELTRARDLLRGRPEPIAAAATVDEQP